MTVFGDDEPEDAWCPTDSVEVCIDDLRRRAALLDPSTTVPGGAPRHALDALDAIVRAALTRHANGEVVNLVRVDELAEDIKFMRGRV